MQEIGNIKIHLKHFRFRHHIKLGRRGFILLQPLHQSFMSTNMQTTLLIKVHSLKCFIYGKTLESLVLDVPLRRFYSKSSFH